jgi:hypothetical protein
MTLDLSLILSKMPQYIWREMIDKRSAFALKS